MPSLALQTTTTDLALSFLRQRVHTDIAAKLLSCDHAPKNTHHCGSSYCPQCTRWRAYGETCVLRQRLAQNPTNKTLFLNLTIGSVATDQLRITAKSLISGFDALTGTGPLSKAKGTYRWLELKDDHGEENLHLHAIASMGPSYSGRNHLSNSRLNELWYESIGSSYRSAEVERISSPEEIARVTGYCSQIQKFTDAAKIGTDDQERYMLRVDQLRGLPRYAGAGVLGETSPPDFLSH